MQNSGTKLVVALVGLALVLGGISWWYRYATVRRATHFWGPEASRLIAESDGFAVQEASPSGDVKTTDWSSARGQAHLRHALLSDRNYRWDQPRDEAEVEWHWRLMFYDVDGMKGNGGVGGPHGVGVELARDFTAIGRRDPQTNVITAYSCAPMTESLQQYFEAQGLLAKTQAPGEGELNASGSEE